MATEDLVNELKGAFNVFDVDRQGQLDRGQLKTAMRQLGTCSSRPGAGFSARSGAVAGLLVCLFASIETYQRPSRHLYAFHRDERCGALLISPRLMTTDIFCPTNSHLPCVAARSPLSLHPEQASSPPMRTFRK